MAWGPGLPIPGERSTGENRFLAAVMRVPLSRLAVAVAVVFGLFAYSWAFQATWVDDAYIQLRYARTLLDSGTWGFYPGYPANTATPPLNVLLIAALGWPLG